MAKKKGSEKHTSTFSQPTTAKTSGKPTKNVNVNGAAIGTKGK